MPTSKVICSATSRSETQLCVFRSILAYKTITSWSNVTEYVYTVSVHFILKLPFPILILNNTEIKKVKRLSLIVLLMNRLLIPTPKGH